MFEILPAAGSDLPEIDLLLDMGFGPARHNRTAYRLRDGAAPEPALSFVARSAGQLIGSVQCWPILLSAPGRSTALTLLGPLVVAADRRGEGIGAALVHAAIAAADATRGPPILLIGDLPFYARFGFSNAATSGWGLPGPVARERLLLRGDPSALPRRAIVSAARPAGIGRAAA